MSLKYVPNYISILRIILTIYLLSQELYSNTFILVYILCGLTDFLDGYIARKFKFDTPFGARLDTIADIVIFSVLFYMYIPRIYIPNEIILWIILIASVRIISIGVILYKYKTFAMLHTYGNKITGFLLFITPLMLSFMSVTITSIVLCLASSLSALDELIINLKSKKFSVNRKSIFSDETL